MKCSECENLLYDYLDNTLDSSTTEQINTHFSQCASCYAKFLDLQQALAIFKSGLSSVKASDDFTQKVMWEIEQREAVNFWSYAIAGLLGSTALTLAVCTAFLYPVIGIVIKYTVQFFTLLHAFATVLPFNNILLIVFSVVLFFVAVAMRGVINMEEGQV